MARAALSTITRAIQVGVAQPVVTSGTADGLQFIHARATIVEVYNSGAGSHDVTFQANYTKDGLGLEDLVITLAAGITKYVLIDSSVFHQTTAGEVFIDIDGTQAEVKFRFLST